MLTVFSTPKPFIGHINVIQRNAIRSWTLLHPDVEVILFGDEEGAAEVCQEFGLRHEPEVKRSPSGAKYLNHIFNRAQQIASHDIVCYVNCDIMLMSQFTRALGQVKSKHPHFLMSGRRWDTDITQPWDFSQPDWETRLSSTARDRGKLQLPHFIDYFAFPRGTFCGMPSLVIGRVSWDNWLIWKAKSIGAAVFDATGVVTAVHQNHDYSYHPQGATGVWCDEEARRNFALAGGERHLHTLDDATHELTPSGQKYNWAHRFAPCRRYVLRSVRPTWFAILDATLPLRRRLGLRHRFPARTAAKNS